MTQQTHPSLPAPWSGVSSPSISAFTCIPQRSSSLSAASGVHSQVSLNDLSTFLEQESWAKISDAQQCLIQVHSSIAAQTKHKYYLNTLS